MYRAQRARAKAPAGAGAKLGRNLERDGTGRNHVAARKRKAPPAKRGKPKTQQGAKASTARKGRPGRKTKLTREVLNEIVRLIEAGDFPEVAAGVAGVGRSTYFEWLEKGRHARADSLLGEFRIAVTRACDVAESSMRQAISQGDGEATSFGKAKATLELMSRRFPKRWAQRVKQEIDDSNRLVIDVLRRICREENCEAIFIRFCEELARLDSEGEPEGAGDPAATVH